MLSKFMPARYMQALKSFLIDVHPSRRESDLILECSKINYVRTCRSMVRASFSCVSAILATYLWASNIVSAIATGEVLLIGLYTSISVALMTTFALFSSLAMKAIYLGVKDALRLRRALREAHVRRLCINSIGCATERNLAIALVRSTGINNSGEKFHVSRPLASEFRTECIHLLRELALLGTALLKLDTIDRT